MNSEEKKITLTGEDGEAVDFYVLEETRLGGVNYLLVTDAGDGEEGEGYILKDLSKQEEAEALYEFVEDDNEIDYLFKIFSELLDSSEVDIQA